MMTSFGEVKFPSTDKASRTWDTRDRSDQMTSYGQQAVDHDMEHQARSATEDTDHRGPSDQGTAINPVTGPTPGTAQPTVHSSR
ncbi:hypothetical protein RRG08_060702 [Elysia crispata]|uniref:Uncharacterized protein n=1 Tax=Elysia crispata TaxID=231223 RepID=A0AAE0YTG8_9GAST|nr:hypothetical protein RRG08_060702 [Elysia crispata]